MDGMTRKRFLAASATSVAAATAGPNLLSALAAEHRAQPGHGVCLNRLLPNAQQIAARGGDPADLGVLECAALLQSRLLSSGELTQACLRRIDQRDSSVNGWVRVYRKRAARSSKGADYRLGARAHGRHRDISLLTGIPIGVKDIYAVAGLPLTASSRVLLGNQPAAHSAVWRQLGRSGMVLLGHTHTHEFAAGNFTPQSANPWDTSRTPGGSTGGGAIALASRMVPAAVGSDTLGSLRIPASLCGLTALKPTRGLVSLVGVIPLASSFDHAGPIARSAADTALLLSHMVPASRQRNVGRQHSCLEGTYLRRPARGQRPLSGVRIGIPDQVFGGLEPTAAIAALVERFGAELERLGAQRVPFRAPRSPADNLSTPAGFEFFSTVPGAEIDSYHRRYFPQRSAEYTPDVAQLLTFLRAANTPAQDPGPGQAVVTNLSRMWKETFTHKRLHAVLQPAALIETPSRQEASARTQAIGDPMVVWDYIGFPVLCLPAGLSSATYLPIGVQLAGPPGSDARLLRIGIEAQAHYSHHQLVPPHYA